MPRFRYSAWDGTQVGFDFDADDLFEAINEDLAYHGDPNKALRDLLQRGFRDRNGRDIQGLRELLERLRRKRQEQLQRYDVGSAFEEVAEAVREILDQERSTIDQLVEQAQQSGDRRRAEQTDEMAAEHQLALDLLPPDLPGEIQALQNYDWVSSEAHQRFDELLERLRSQLLQATFNRMAGAMSNVSPEALNRTREMFDELNRLLEARQEGRDTQEDFEAFMERFGDMFPGNPQSLDELLEQLARQMAAMSNLLSSLTPEQRAQLEGLSDALLSDMDLRWQVERLGANLRQMFPGAGWDQQRMFEGFDPLGLPEAASLMNQLGDMDQLEQLLSGTPNPGALADVDLDAARQLLGNDAAQSLEQLARATRQLLEAGLIDQREGRLELTPRGVRRLGQAALSELFTRLLKDRFGRHSTARTGIGHERTYDTKPYEWGDPFNLSIERTVRNALSRRGPGTPVRLAPEDFEVEQTEALTRTSTVLMVDLSLSMPMRNNFLAAKKVAMALHALIHAQYPSDYLGLVGFSTIARELTPEQLPEVSWDFGFGTNMAHGFMLARRLLARQSGTKQVIMITDGEPTAHLLENGQPFFSYPPSPETVAATLAEVNRLTRENIRINTFMLDSTSYLKDFVERMTKLNRGRAFFTTPETLGEYVLVDFLEQKRARRGQRYRTA